MTMWPTPLIVPSGLEAGTPVSLTRVPFAARPTAGTFSEDWLQELLFRNPGVLPSTEIDPSYGALVPLCRELNTSAGPIDLVFVTPTGKLALVETKLWRNPEARREVVAQILDYAKELASWEYEDLLREVARRSGATGNDIYDRVRDAPGALEEARFVDQVSRNLRTGQFLLLIVGDGIREGVGAMAEFLDRFGSLQFTFGLVEIGVHEIPGTGRLVQARTLAKTVIIKRTVVEVNERAAASVLDSTQPEREGGEDPDPLRAERAAFYRKFWSEFLATLSLDDASQPNAKPNESTNVYFMMPPSGGSAWVSAYFAPSRNRVGVYLTFARNSAIAPMAWQSFAAEKEAIVRELGVDAEWLESDGKYSVVSRMNFDSLDSPAALERIRGFFRLHVNRYVNVFRPRLERIARTL